MNRFLFFRNILLTAFLFAVIPPYFSACMSTQPRYGNLCSDLGEWALFTDDIPMQVTQTFPIPLKEYDASILPNNYLSFIAYQGQARIYFLTSYLRSFDLYINNCKIATDRICTGKPVCMDVSPYIKNGRNVLYISGLVPSDAQKTTAFSLQVKIPYPVILPLQPEWPTEPYSQTAMEFLDQLLTAETENGFPGIQLAIVKNGRIIKSSGYGVISRVDAQGTLLEEPIPVTAETLFDIASNTKMYAANFTLQKLISEKKLLLSDPVQKFFPGFIDGKKDRIKGKGTVTVFDLLTHQSGLPAGRPYSKRIAKIKNAAEKSYRQHTLDLILETPLVYSPRSSILYSDVNYMLLTHIIEKITGTNLADYAEKMFYRPLGLKRICFTPLQHGFSLDEIAATEIEGASRTVTGQPAASSKALVHGTVHDEEAFTAMEQISGHAGLFANAESLAVLAQVMLNNGGYGHDRFFEPGVTGYFTAQQSMLSSMGLGWRRQGKQEYCWAFSPLASENSFGHTGWTGTLTLIDPAEQLVIILLTNAKNTVPAHNSRNGRFEGDYYLVKRYGAVINLIYELFRNPSQEKLDGMLIELAEKKYEMLESVKAFRNQGYINDLRAIMQTVQIRAAQSALLRRFLEDTTAARIIQTIDKTKPEN